MENDKIVTPQDIIIFIKELIGKKERELQYLKDELKLFEEENGSIE